jgi:hypothetical protein
MLLANDIFKYIANQPKRLTNLIARPCLNVIVVQIISVPSFLKYLLTVEIRVSMQRLDGYFEKITLNYS